MKVSIKSVSEYTRISYATVYNVLAGKGHAGEATVERIWAAAKILGYTSHPGAIQGVRLLVLGEQAHYMSFVTAFSRILTAAGMPLELCFVQSSPDLRQQLLEAGKKSVIVVAAYPSDDDVEILKKALFPVMLISARANIRNLCCLTIDWGAAAMEGWRYLRRSGYKRISLLYRTWQGHLFDRIGWHQCMEVSACAGKTGACLQTLFIDRLDIPDAIMTQDDIIAIGAMGLLRGHRCIGGRDCPVISLGHAGCGTPLTAAQSPMRYEVDYSMLAQQSLRLLADSALTQGGMTACIRYVPRLLAAPSGFHPGLATL